MISLIRCVGHCVEPFMQIVIIQNTNITSAVICLSSHFRLKARLSRYLKVFYTDLALKEPIVPQWAHPTAPGALCSARLEPDFRLHSQSHGFSESLSVDQLLTPIQVSICQRSFRRWDSFNGNHFSVQTKDGQFVEAPRRVLIECPHWVSRNSLALRILHAWAREPPWPTRGTPVAISLYIPLAELNTKKGIANFVEKVRLVRLHARRKQIIDRVSYCR